MDQYLRRILKHSIASFFCCSAIAAILLLETAMPVFAGTEPVLHDFSHTSKEELQALVDDIVKRAAQGDPKAQDTLAREKYFWPWAKPEDMARAYNLFREAADHGNGDAQEALGEMYERGWHVKLDYAEAARWYRRAAGYGDTRAMFRLAFMYEKGWGVPQDYEEADFWLRMSDKISSGLSGYRDEIRRVEYFLTGVQRLEVEKRVSEYNLHYAIPLSWMSTPESPPPREFCDKNFRDVSTIYWRASNTLPADINTPPWKDVEANIDDVLKSFVTANTKTASFSGIRIIKADKSSDETLASDPNAIYVDMDFKIVGAYSSWGPADSPPLRDLSVKAHIIRHYGHDNLFRGMMYAPAEEPTPNGPKMESFFLQPTRVLTDIGCLVLANSANKMCSAIRDLKKNTVVPMPVSCPP